MDGRDTSLAVQAAFTAFKTYKQTTARSRARLLRKWSDLCHENAEDLALILTLQNGKTLSEAKGEVTYGASFLEWFVTQAEMTHGDGYLTDDCFLVVFRADDHYGDAYGDANDAGGDVCAPPRTVQI